AALASASAIAKEKDRRTFVLLLMTDMTDTEIVLGKVLGSLLPMVLLQLAAVPVLMSVLMLGGTSPAQVIQAVTVVAATYLAAGSLGGVVALWRDKTFQSLALTLLLIGVYFGVVEGLALLPGLTPEALAGVQSWLDPFRALRTAHRPMSVLDPGLPPAYGFALVMLGL